MSEVKVKLSLCKPQSHTEQVEVWRHLTLTLALDGGGDELQAKATFLPGKSPAFIDELAEWATEAVLSVRIYQFSTTQNTPPGK